MVEDWRNDGDVRQVAAARQLGVVAEQDVALAQALIRTRAAGTPIPQLSARQGLSISWSEWTLVSHLISINDNCTCRQVRELRTGCMSTQSNSH